MKTDCQDETASSYLRLNEGKLVSAHLSATNTHLLLTLFTRRQSGMAPVGPSGFDSAESSSMAERYEEVLEMRWIRRARKRGGDEDQESVAEYLRLEVGDDEPWCN